MKLGVIGTGQLSLLMAQSCQDMDLEFIPIGEPNTARLGDYCTPIYAPTSDLEAYQRFAESVDVISYESESVSVDLLESLNCPEKIKPAIQSLKIFQNRLNEKNYLRDQGLNIVKFKALLADADLNGAGEYVGFPAIIKTISDGYDGRGQVLVHNDKELAEGWKSLAKLPCVMEAFFKFDHEISIVAVRDERKNIAFYPVSENHHRQGQLRLSIVNGSHPLQSLAEASIKKVLEDLDYVGCMSMEFFVKGDELYVNEVAPRVHNSGHWTMDGADSSQFLKHIEAVAGKPVQSPVCKERVAMINLIGSMPERSTFPSSDHLAFYDYGKEAKHERKLGHLNVLGDDQTEQEFYTNVANILEQLGEKSLADDVFKRAMSAASEA